MAHSAKKYEKGFIIVYYGDGKGKTTAALGLAMRALGRGMNVAVLQFIKSDPGVGKGITWTSGERIFAQVFVRYKIQDTRYKNRIGKLYVKTTGEGFVGIQGDERPFEEHKAAAVKGLRSAEEALRKGKFHVVILDEALRAVEEKLFSAKDLMKALRNKKKGVHVVLTGHHVAKEILEIADLVTEMKKVKHPYDKGILAKIGIDF
ncbi:MAG: cob(I)yrinic acid a,c-diamide adenosyltransferase [Patescibacteria group bacterium]